MPGQMPTGDEVSDDHERVAAKLRNRLSPAPMKALRAVRDPYAQAEGASYCDAISASPLPGDGRPPLERKLRMGE